MGFRYICMLLVALVLVGQLNASAGTSAGAVNVAAGQNSFELVEGSVFLDFRSQPVPYNYFGGDSHVIDSCLAMQICPYSPQSNFVLSHSAFELPVDGTPAIVDFELTMPAFLSKEVITVEFDSIAEPGFYSVLAVPTAAATGSLALKADANNSLSGGDILANLDSDGDGIIDSSFSLDYTIYFNETCMCSSRSMRIHGARLNLGSSLDYMLGDAPAWLDSDASDTDQLFYPAVDVANSRPQNFALRGVRLRFKMTLPDDGTVAILGDANGDGSVDIADFAILKANYGRSAASFAQGDFNGDGRIDLDDFIILKRNYGKTAQ